MRTDKIVLMRESFEKKTKVKEGFLAFQPNQKLFCSSFWLRGGGEDYVGQLSLHASQALAAYFLLFAGPMSDHWLPLSPTQ